MTGESAMLTAHANAKINWSLSIRGRRPDGYHELDMLMQSISFSGLIIFTMGSSER